VNCSFCTNENQQLCHLIQKKKNLWMHPVWNQKIKVTYSHHWWWNYRTPFRKEQIYDCPIEENHECPCEIENHNRWRKALHVKEKKITLPPQCCCNLWMALLRHNSLMATSQPPLPTWRYSPVEHSSSSAIQRHTVQNLLKLSKNENINFASRHDKYLRWRWRNSEKK
jgi:hypothetical protein